VFYDLTYTPVLLDNLSLPPDHRYILDQGHPPCVLPSSSPLYLTRPESRQYVLEQAALILNQPVNALLDLSNQQYPFASHLQHHPDPEGQHHFHKRLRLSPSVSMPSLPYSDGLPVHHGQEKSPLGPPAGQPDAGTGATRKPHGLFPGRDVATGWTSTRLADCFGSFSMCPPFQSQPGRLPLFVPRRSALQRKKS
jgi:hypothetical protein